jgi:ammonium transporter
LFLGLTGSTAWAAEAAPRKAAMLPTATPAPLTAAELAWPLLTCLLVLFLLPGLALFNGGLVRRKNILATMMQVMICLALVSVYWIALGYNLAFGKSLVGVIGWSNELVFLYGVGPTSPSPAGPGVPLYLHVFYHGLLAALAPAILAGAMAERVRFGPFCLFVLLWLTFVYCPLAHAVWARDCFGLAAGVPLGEKCVGWLSHWGLRDFGGGIVVQVAAGFSGLATICVIRRRQGFPESVMQPNSMVRTLFGVGLLWFGWFGLTGAFAFGLASGFDKADPPGTAGLLVSALLATQLAAAAAALGWLAAEWWHHGKPTAIGFASGAVAGLVAISVGAGWITAPVAVATGLTAGLICYIAVSLKTRLKYDDALDAFGVHGIGGLWGAILSGLVLPRLASVESAWDGVALQTLLTLLAAVLCFAVTWLLAKLIEITIGLTADRSAETDGLDRSEHGGIGFDVGHDLSLKPTVARAEPRPASLPPDGILRYSMVVEGVETDELTRVWSALCQATSQQPTPEFRRVYACVTTIVGNRFRFRGGEPQNLRDDLERLLRDQLRSASVRVRLET